MRQLAQIKQSLRMVSTAERAKNSQRYFKTGPGEYGEGDVFVGATMPQQRIIAKSHLDLSLHNIQKLLDSKVHEERMIGLLILTYQYPKGGVDEKNSIYDFYLNNTARINNWDLVDVTAPRIIGIHLIDKDRTVLTKLAKSKLLWDRRVSVLATSAFINQGESEWTFKVAKILLNDPEDLIHKATGWMLREVGKKCGQSVEMKFLDKYYLSMPRTMLRYSLEKFSPNDRKKYMQA